MKTHIVFEAETNHNGDPKLARKMIHEAKACGADYIKFQFIVADSLAARSSPYWEAFRAVELTRETFRGLKEEAESIGLGFFATVPDITTVPWVTDLGLTIVKVGSSNVTNLPLLRAVGRLGIMTILSTGASNPHEIREALGAIGHRFVLLLHCTVQYPTPPEDANISMMDYLRQVFPGYRYGLSDHTEGWHAAFLAVAMGARVVEKHFTLSHDLPGPDHSFSADPADMREFVRHVRLAETILGSYEKRPTAREAVMIPRIRRYIVAARDLPAGTVLQDGDLALKRVGESTVTCLEARHLPDLVGRKMTRDVAVDEPVTMEVVR